MSYISDNEASSLLLSLEGVTLVRNTLRRVGWRKAVQDDGAGDSDDTTTTNTAEGIVIVLMYHQSIWVKVYESEMAKGKDILTKYQRW